LGEQWFVMADKVVVPFPRHQPKSVLTRALVLAWACVMSRAHHDLTEGESNNG
jgi:hypothetical protein